MDAEAYTDAASSAAISSTCTAPKDCDLMEDKLPKLSATPISVCRRLVLQQAVETLGLSMHETTTYDDESNEILTAVRIDVPPHIRLTQLETRIFYGDWSLTTDAATQSACFNALVYLQKVNILIIDGIHSAELRHCQRELLQASSWAEAFEQHADKLQSKLSAMVKEKTPVLPVSQNQAKVNLIQETTDTKKCTDEHLLGPSGSAQIPQSVVEKGTSSWIAFVNLPKNTERPAFEVRINGNLPFGKQKRNVSVPVPQPARAAFNWKKRKLIVDSRRPQTQVATLPSLDSSSEDMSAAVTNYSDGTAYVSPIHIDPGRTFPSLSTPPFGSKTIALKCTKTIPLYSKVRKPLFQAGEDKGKATELGDKVLKNTGDPGETDEKTEP